MTLADYHDCYNALAAAQNQSNAQAMLRLAADSIADWATVPGAVGRSAATLLFTYHAAFLVFGREPDSAFDINAWSDAMTFVRAAA